MTHRIRTLFVILLAAAAVSTVSFGQKKTETQSVLKPVALAEKDLPQKYRTFLTEVVYIITQKEREVFLQLTNDKDRDIFMESFWKLRDPTPGTPENEFKIEHYKRLEYANKFLGRGTGRPGWMTDQGKFYIILGQPISIDRYESELGLRPCEIWYYYTDGSKGMPLHFGLVFFQKAGAGEKKLYDPFVDGPKALMAQTPNALQIDPEDYEAQYERILEIAPALADMAISLIPGEYGYGYAPSPRNTMLIADILNSPKADIRPSYATHFLDYKGMVSTEYMSNYVDSEAVVSVLAEPALGTSFIHFSIRPLKASVNYFAPKDQYFSSFSISVSLRRPAPAANPVAGDLIFQYSREFPFYFPAGEVDKVRSNGVTIEDAFPVMAGKYRLSILLQNAVGKEFSLVEQDVDVPGPGEQPRLTGPIFGYRQQDSPANVLAPFLFGRKKIMIDPKKLYGSGDTIVFGLLVENAQGLRADGRIRLSIKGASKKPEGQKVMEYPLRDFPATRNIPLIESLLAKDFPPDYYEVEAVLLDGTGKTLATGAGQFIVSTAERVGHPIPNAKGAPLTSRYLYYGMLAQQAAGQMKTDEADAFYRKVFELRPDFSRGWAEYGGFLLKVGRFDQSLEAAEHFRADSSLHFEYLALRGKALAGQEKYLEASQSLLEAARVYNSDTSVLNALGRCYFKLNKKSEAIDILKASLRLNDAQDDVKKLLNDVEKMK